MQLAMTRQKREEVREEVITQGMELKVSFKDAPLDLGTGNSVGDPAMRSRRVLRMVSLVR